MPKILIVDDESSIRGVLHQLFEYEGHDVAEAESGPDAIDLFAEFKPDVTFLDVKMPGMDGLEVLKRLLEEDPAALFVMISGHGTIDTAVEATRIGAYDFLEKPLDTARLQVTLRNALEVRGLSDSVERLKSEVESRHEMVGASFSIRQVLERIERVAPADARVLITGENGTGKELVARAVHRLSGRSERPFVEVNCAAIPSELIESELFGHIKGSFTGAVADRAGKFEQADRRYAVPGRGWGHVASRPRRKCSAHSKRAWSRRVGGSRSPSTVDVRVIAATNKDLESEIAEGRFPRGPVLPPQRRARSTCLRCGSEGTTSPCWSGTSPNGWSTRDGVHGSRVFDRRRQCSASMENEWPGNVRQLRNTVERLLILADGATGHRRRRCTEQVWCRGPDGAGGLGGELLSARRPFPTSRMRPSGPIILQKLREHDWNVSETARSDGNAAVQPLQEDREVRVGPRGLGARRGFASRS